MKSKNMKSKMRRLKPIAIALPGLLGVCAEANWHGSAGANPQPDYGAYASTSGQTYAQYYKAGYPIYIKKRSVGTKRAGGVDYFDEATVYGDSVSTAYSWNEGTYNNGYSEVYNAGDSGNYGVGQVGSDI